MPPSDDGAVLNRRELIRTRAYGDSKKLRARQALWAYVEERPATNRVRQVFDLHGDERILDVGCGNGTDLLALRREGLRGPLIGLDLSLGMVSEIDPELAVRAVGDAIQLPIASGVADVVLAMHMLYHVPDIARALVEIRRVLRPEGTFVASTNSRDTAPELKGPWSEAMVAAGGPAVVRNSDRSFSLENGADVLAQVFPSVEVKVATSTSMVPDARIVRDYVASTDDLYAPMMPTPDAWSNVLDALESYARGVIERRGAFPITSRRGIFICRGDTSSR